MNVVSLGKMNNEEEKHIELLKVRDRVRSNSNMAKWREKLDKLSSIVNCEVWIEQRLSGFF